MDKLLSSRPDELDQRRFYATSACIFSAISVQTSGEPLKVLLIKRAASDTLPNHWEVPGGAIDATDESVRHAVAREVYEETGLEVIEFLTQLPNSAFTTRRRKNIIQFNFVVEVKTRDNIVLDPKEHQDFMWAEEHELNGLLMTSDQKTKVLRAFEYLQKLSQESKM